MFGLILKVSEYLTPLSTLTYLSSKLTDAKMGGFTQWLIKKFADTYHIDLNECEQSDLSKYETFNDFFIRKLKPEARPIAPISECIGVSPVDGTVGQADDIKAGRLIQAKGIDYSLAALVGGRQEDISLFDGGRFACIYLSPANYHRIHMPLNGKLLRTIHIPGRHFPVGKRNVSYMDDLFTKNERLVCIFETERGPLAVIMVGAALVGSIGTVWDGTVVRRSGIEVKDYTDRDLHYQRGDEIGHFKFGSTVITLFPKSLGDLDDSLVSGYVIKMGQKLIANPKLS
ncbi:MAG: phosphatidylserine decarboxylase [Candidatus Anaerobiospirillum pullicola]|uniref:Phosphatidylserine decarboxylase proenzyme n=1 Tax=Candidatus Anaerobiospirillum pullicola TaxID=2838451 RepID=A0A948TEQ5_9GAMM|nr:phosphatidylserine decarboxylase [Candidatus Anaerobiospirillum pullicola]